ncbi:MAG: hypothetical protein GWN84_16890 [Gammaproteobacteria bacterium]|nr:hypothetical protein [Gammaproteobacteria bacterium]NIR84514.1 hypothetical protein [Gammaproteobacteria bacterium]NIR90417.1 hypothetical protein [Gammaproteobacteria bacterium]NIU05565.1 hypothetical protein [Gammaproteobacteria bacterium]NIV52704.1 hypothetical protein [Gammaproteobacteria bacterium]
MKRFARLCMVAPLLFAFGTPAQEMTERYIPVGAYPGLADRQTTVGAVVAIDPGERTVTLRGDSGLRRFRVTDSTHIWLDRSQLGQSTLDVKLSDLPDLPPGGLRAEVRALGPERADTARWLKVQLPPPNG